MSHEAPKLSMMFFYYHLNVTRSAETLNDCILGVALVGAQAIANLRHGPGSQSQGSDLQGLRFCAWLRRLARSAAELSGKNSAAARLVMSP